MGMVLSRQIHRGFQYSGLLSCEMEYKTEMCELVSEFMPDVTLLDGKSGGGKAKSGIIGIGEVRLVGWEFDRCSDPSWRAHRGLKK